MRVFRLIATVVLAVSFIAGCGEENMTGTGPDTSPTTSPSTTSTTEPTTTTTTESTTTTIEPTTATTEPTTTTTTPTTEPAPSVLRRGDRGDDVAAVQRRLEELRYWVGPVDGVFGRLTEQAVYAFQKVNRIAIDGVVGPETRASLDEPQHAYENESSAGDIIEVDKSLQVLAHVVDGTVQWVWNTSTGTEKPYTYDGEQYVADTPPGRHTIYRQVDGVRDAPLGDLYRPKYFHRDGIAIHGYGSVPPSPDSHGCVRLTFAAMDYLWATRIAPIDSVVLVHGSTPRTSSEGSGPFVG